MREDGPVCATGWQEDDVFVLDDPVRTRVRSRPRRFRLKASATGVVFGRRSGQVRIAATDRDYLRALAGSSVRRSSRASATKHLDSLAFGDVLTGLPNRALLQDRLEQALLSARRHRRAFAAHYIDIDHFKTINDNYGQHVGDEVLVAVSGWLRTTLRDSDTIGRFGGDEFVVLQPEIDSQRQAEELAAKLVRDSRSSLSPRRARHLRDDQRRLRRLPGRCGKPVDMLTAADNALYEVKHRGRDGYTVGSSASLTG